MITVANEHMVAAIKEITINQGVDPREAALVAGGGAAGLGIAAIARELGCRRVLLPRSAGALSAFGGQQADIVSEAGRSLFTDSASFAFAEVGAALDAVDESLAGVGAALAERGVSGATIEHFVEARYAHQVWDLEIPLDRERIATPDDLEALVASFHRTHKRVFAVEEPGQLVEATYWKGRLAAAPAKPPLGGLAPGGGLRAAPAGRAHRLLPRRRAAFRPPSMRAARCRPATGSPGRR